MNFLIVLGLFAIGAYLLQILFGMQQIKHFNHTYQKLRKQGKVAIGRRAGKVKAGTIVMFAVSDEGDILDAVKMQGVTVMAKFKSLPHYKGINIRSLSHDHHLVCKENKLMKHAMMNAKEIYIRVEEGNYVEEKPLSPFMLAKVEAQLLKDKIQMKLKRS